MRGSRRQGDEDWEQEAGGEGAGDRGSRQEEWEQEEGGQGAGSRRQELGRRTGRRRQGK